MTRISVLIAEDHPFTRQTLSYEFKRIPEIEFLGILGNGLEVVNYVKTRTPDVILMDIDMPVLDGIKATEEIKKFNDKIKIVMLTAHSEKEKVLDAFSCGANGYCVKNAKTPELLDVIKIVNDNGIWFDKQIANYIFEILKTIDVEKAKNEVKAKTIKDYNITERERNILKLMADGYTNAQIAEELVISHNTVKNHVASIINKFSLKDRTQVALFAIKNNLLN